MMTSIYTLEDIRHYEQRPLDERFPEQNIPALLQASAERFADDIALEMLWTGEPGEASQCLSYRQLFEEVLKARQLLLRAGFADGQVLALMLPMIPETHILGFAAQCGGIVNPLNPMLEVEHLAGILNETGARILAVCAPQLAPELWARVPSLLARCPALEKLLVIGPPGGVAETDGVPARVEVLDYRALMAECNPEPLARMPDGADIAAYFHTGGTTGRPKIARLSQRNFAFIAQQIEQVTGLPRHTMLNGLPLFHIYGNMVAGLASLIKGNRVVQLTPAGYRTPAVIENFWHLVAAHRANVVPLVPTLFGLLLDADAEGLDLSCLWELGCGAAPMPPGLKRRFRARFDVPIVEGYGMTESCCLIARAAGSPAPEAQAAPAGSVGLRLPYTGLQVASLAGGEVSPLPDGQVGSILISGPNLFAGYLHEEDNRSVWHTDRAGRRWFDTGDCGYLDARGYLFITGRAKDLIIRGGHNIDPLTIEEPLRGHGAVAEVVAVGMPDTRAGELPVVFVQPRAGRSVDEDALLAFAAAQIGERAAVPKRVFPLEEMPLTAVGKIFKPELRRMAAQAAVRDLLQEAGVDASAEVVLSGGSLRLRLEVEAPQAAGARRLLEQLPLALEIVEPAEST
ncbi:AMP-binding protein [Microbulbifer halophilus]|uniref:AMP-binding protein n=2 Tax=Microbulbifer halophilus TaxID=453963 RepID=A0ABW5EEW6_9GAMM|nr:AMP-binding protein [Microbulbifer halophilus]